MILLGISIALAILAVYMYRLRGGRDKYGWVPESVTFVAVVAGIVGVASVGISIGMPVKQQQHAVDIQVLSRKIIIAQDQVNKLLPVVVGELNKYPEHEAKIFENYKSGGFISIPPTLKANETTVAAAKTINTMQGRIYKLREEIEQHRGTMRLNKRIGWVFAVYVPMPTEEE